jgi:hypothetical protein
LCRVVCIGRWIRIRYEEWTGQEEAKYMRSRRKIPHGSMKEKEGEDEDV